MPLVIKLAETVCFYISYQANRKEMQLLNQFNKWQLQLLRKPIDIM